MPQNATHSLTQMKKQKFGFLYTSGNPGREFSWRLWGGEGGVLLCLLGPLQLVISADYRWPIWQPYWLLKRLFHRPTLHSPALKRNGNFPPFSILCLNKAVLLSLPLLWLLISPFSRKEHLVWPRRCSDWKKIEKYSLCFLLGALMNGAG